MAFHTITIKTLDLKLDEKNPRFVTKSSKDLTQEKIMEYLINYEEVISLAKDINNYGGLVPGERLLVIYEDNVYKVLEGNRRTAAMHLLLKPNSYPEGISSARRRTIPKANENCLDSIIELQVDLVNDRDDAVYALSKRHIDGIKRWSQISKMLFYQNLFENGKKISDLRNLTGESNNIITRTLKQYNFLRFILDNYPKYYPNTIISNLEIETELNTDFLINRIYPFISDELNLKFNKKYQIGFSNMDTMKKNLLIEILVKISYLYWGNDGSSGSIHSRNLNKQSEIKRYFTQPAESEPEALEISQLINEYKSIIDQENDQQQDNFGDCTTERDNANNNWSENEDSTQEDSNFSSDDENGNPEENESLNPENDNYKNYADDEDSGQKTNYKPRDPSSYSKLTSAFHLNHFYKINPRINKTKKELDNIDYKEATISAMYLIRSLLESYVHEYIDCFTNLSHESENRMKGIGNTRKKRKGKSLQDMIYGNIKLHLRDTLKGYADTYELIDVTFSNNNDTSTMKIVNYYIHSSTHFPDQTEILNAWSKISTIINTLDTILGDFSGQ